VIDGTVTATQTDGSGARTLAGKFRAVWRQ
jgi:hypothetical protein